MTGREGVWASLSRRLSPYLDVTLGVAAASFAVASLLATDPASVDSRLQSPDALAVLATLTAGLSLVWRRTRPVAAFMVFVGCCLLVTLTNHYIGLLSVLLLFSLYSLAAHGHRRRAGVFGLAVSLVTFAGLALIDVPDLRTSDVVQASALLVTAWAVGDAIRSRRTQQRERLRAAEQEAAAARDQAARAVTEERLRIARELHDVVAHSMSLIAVQAGVGGHVIRSDVDAAERALDVIAETSREALMQTRALLGLLREEGTYADAPARTIGDLDALVAGVREAGVDVSLEVSGLARRLDAGVELTAYRVVQESLTNVLKHSGSPSARVLVSYSTDSVGVEVVDAGRGLRPSAGAGAETGGHGLVGLRERARMLGGTLEYGAAPGIGFRVAARLPAGPMQEAS